jgi:MFS family permease
VDAQLYSIIPYAFAIVSTPTFCYISDRLGKKAIPMLFCLGTTIIGFIILLTTTNKVALIGGCCFVATGGYPAIGIGASWITSIHGGYTKRSTAFGVCQIFIQGYSIIATQVYNKPPRFYKGHGVLLGLYTLALICTLVLYFWLKKQNRDRDAVAEILRDNGEQDPSAYKTFEELYDYHPNWRYPV